MAATVSFSDSELTFEASASRVDAVESLTLNFQIRHADGGRDGLVFLGLRDFSDSYTLDSGENSLSVEVPASDLTPNLDDNFLYGSYSEMLVAGVNNNGEDGANTSDFGDTVQLTSIDATDANGDFVAGIFTDGDVLSFPANMDLTPEPSTTMLLPPPRCCWCFW